MTETTRVEPTDEEVRWFTEFDNRLASATSALIMLMSKTEKLDGDFLLGVKSKIEQLQSSVYCELYK